MGFFVFRAGSSQPNPVTSAAPPKAAGLMFVFAGVLIGLPPEYTRWRALLGTLVVTCFAPTFDWVAFGPGERKFNGSFVGIGFVPSELMGRICFGFFAVVLDSGP
jgi:hypothetical protein